VLCKLEAADEVVELELELELAAPAELDDDELETRLLVVALLITDMTYPY
jgi:hypothetical protein